jgi:DNA ligase-1
MKYVNGLVPPMLAMKYDPDRVVFPCVVQPKLDGIRCLAACGRDSFVVLHSRGGQVLRLPHIEKSLGALMRAGDVWDGELYMHGKPFDAIKEMLASAAEQLEFHVFDRVSGEPFAARMACVRAGGPIQTVKTSEAKTRKEIEMIHEQFRDAGYEGVVLRDPDAGYKHARSYALMKLKTFDDSEFRAVSFDIAADHSLLITCLTGEGIRFRARLPRASTAAVDFEAGVTVTVRHLGWTSGGVPRQPHALRVRPACDLAA